MVWIYVCLAHATDFCDFGLLGCRHLGLQLEWFGEYLTFC